MATDGTFGSVRHAANACFAGTESGRGKTHTADARGARWDTATWMQRRVICMDAGGEDGRDGRLRRGSCMRSLR